jgi:uncharacterized circularly permuted ATP-grasp superfamily protein
VAGPARAAPSEGEAQIEASSVTVPRYQPGPSVDEAVLPSGAPRPGYEPLLAHLADVDLAELRQAIDTSTRQAGLVFGGEGGQTPFRVDPVPRLLGGGEWAELERGLAQRVRALEAFVADMHGAQAMVAAGELPQSVLAGAGFIEPDLFGLELPGPWISLAGLDVVRDGAGRLCVLEDNLRTPSGLAYALGARAALERSMPLDSLPADELAAHVKRLFQMVLAPPPPAACEPDGARVLLSDGPSNSAWYEQQLLAELLGLPLVGLDGLRVRGNRLELADDGQAVHVVYRRTDEERVRDDSGALTRLGELLLEPVRAGSVRLANCFGTGVADDKLVYPHVEAMIRFYLGEGPLLRSVQTYDLDRPALRDQVFDRLGELVVKPRDGHGGAGVVIGPHASRAELDGAVRAIRAEPERWLAQDVVELSTHPTVIDGRLEPRHIDLRPFVFSDGENIEALPGGLTRVAFARGSMVVNSSRQGGGKDTRVLP